MACCSKGTRPGDPLADIIINLGMSFTLSEVDKCRDELPSVRWEAMKGPFLGTSESLEVISCLELSHVDDLALCISHECPSQLCDRVTAITDGLTEIMASFGLQLNMNARKTECILNLRGRGTGEAKRHGRNGKQIILPTKYANLSIVQSYCHLGIIWTRSGCMTPEIAKRCKAVLGAYVPIAHRVFASSEISRSTKMQLAHALFDDILVCGAATWLQLSGERSARLETVRCRVLREISQHFRGPVDGHTSQN